LFAEWLIDVGTTIEGPHSVDIRGAQRYILMPVFPDNVSPFLEALNSPLVEVLFSGGIFTA